MSEKFLLLKMGGLWILSVFFCLLPLYLLFSLSIENVRSCLTIFSPFQVLGNLCVCFASIFNAIFSTFSTLTSSSPKTSLLCPSNISFHHCILLLVITQQCWNIEIIEQSQDSLLSFQVSHIKLAPFLPIWVHSCLFPFLSFLGFHWQPVADTFNSLFHCHFLLMCLGKNQF